MNPLCTLYVSSRRIGVLTGIPIDEKSMRMAYGIMDPVGSQTSLPSLHLTPIDRKAVDEPLRKLSSVDYMIFLEKQVMYKDKYYSVTGDIPVGAQFKAVPIVPGELYDVKPTCSFDELLLHQGYARELNDAQFILVPPSLDEFSGSCTPADLVISGKSGDTWIAYNARATDSVSVKSNRDRHLLLEEMPVFTGIARDTPYTYTRDTLIGKYQVLQERLYDHGNRKVLSLCSSLKSLPTRLMNLNDQFKASLLYDEVVDLLEKTRKLE